jgi:hypothetical protein
LASFCFKYNYSKGEFSWAKIPVGECGERNINREIGFKESNLVRKAVCNHESKNCDSCSAASFKLRVLSKVISP